MTKKQISKIVFLIFLMLIVSLLPIQSSFVFANPDTDSGECAYGGWVFGAGLFDNVGGYPGNQQATNGNCCGDDASEVFFDFTDNSRDACCQQSNNCVSVTPIGRCYASNIPSSGGAGGETLCYGGSWNSCSSGNECASNGDWKCANDGSSWGWYQSGSMPSEVCDGFDNDCDGTYNEGLSQSESCGSDVGECYSGSRSRSCTVGGSWGSWGSCVTYDQGCGYGGPCTEQCDGLDNDCDNVQDGSEDLTHQCGTTDVGACTLGSESCTNDGVWTSCNAILPSTEYCDGIDSDCDGVDDADENFEYDACEYSCLNNAAYGGDAFGSGLFDYTVGNSQAIQDDCCGDDASEVFFDFTDNSRDACCQQSTDCVTGSPVGNCFSSGSLTSGSPGGGWLCYENNWQTCTDSNHGVGCQVVYGGGSDWTCTKSFGGSWGWYETSNLPIEGDTADNVDNDCDSLIDEGTANCNAAGLYNDYCNVLYADQIVDDISKSFFPINAVSFSLQSDVTCDEYCGVDSKNFGCDNELGEALCWSNTVGGFSEGDECQLAAYGGVTEFGFISSEGICCTQVFFLDADSDGFGNNDGVAETTCAQPESYVDNNDDCNDIDPSVNPIAEEIEDGVDNDCDGLIDEGTANCNPIGLYNDYCNVLLGPQILDDETKPFFAISDSIYQTVNNVVCSDYCSTDFGCDSNTGSALCWDVVGFNEGESCNLGTYGGQVSGVFNSEGVCVCNDQDGDGFGNPGASICSNGEATDCNDNNQYEYPNSNPEVCDGNDNNCDGTMMNFEYSYSTGTEACDGFDTDCDGAIDYNQYEYDYSTGVEICNGLDDNCDGAIDYNQYEYDYSTGVEICNGLDDDCDGSVDELECELRIEYYYDDECGTADVYNTWGKICGVFDESGATHFIYDLKGNIIRTIKSDNAINMLVNPGFELVKNTIEPHYWSAYANSQWFSIVYDECSGGSACWKVDHLPGEPTSAGTQYVRVKGGEEYTLSAWIKTSGTGTNKIYLAYVDDKPSSSWLSIANSQQSGSTNGEWIKHKVTLQAPINAKYARVLLPYVDGALAVWIDNVQLTKDYSDTPFLENTYITDYAYDDFGNVISITDPGGTITNYLYNNLGNIEKVLVDGVSTSSDYFAKYEYTATDAFDRLYLGLQNNYIYYEYDYNDMGRLEEISAINNQGDTLAPLGFINEEYGYDDVGNLDYIHMGGQSLDLEYDEFDRLTVSTDNNYLGYSLEYTYDVAGNRQSKTIDTTTYNYEYFYGTNALKSDGEYNYTYDMSGNIISKINRTSGETKTFEYDGEGKLVSMTQSNGKIIEYVYDYNGKRVRKTDNYGKIYLSFYDQGTNILFEIDDEGTFPCELLTFDSTNKNLKIMYDEEIIAAFDSTGILAIAGQITNTPPIGERNFEMRNSNDNLVSAITYEGNLYLSNEENLVEWVRMPSKAEIDRKELIIKDPNSEMDIASFTESGEIILGRCVLENAGNLLATI